MRQQPTRPVFPASDFLQSLQRRLIFLVGGVLLFITLLIGLSLPYLILFDRWEVWLGFGSSLVILSIFTLWLLRQYLRRQLESVQFEAETTATDEVAPTSPLEYKATFGHDFESDETEAAPPSKTLSSISAELEAATYELARLRQMEAELTRRNRELTILQLAGVAITLSLDLRYVLDTVVEQMARLIEVESCTLFEWNQPQDTITSLARYDAAGWWSPETLPHVRPLTDYPLTKSVLEEQIPEQMTLSQPYLDPAEATYMREANIKTRLLLPMVFQQRVLGLVELEDSHLERSFMPPEIALIKLLANQAGSAIENARLYQQAQQEIEERQRAEAALAEERALLAQRVQERTAELSRVNAELARAARLKDEFLANMSHELRTPLNVIIGSAELLQKETFGELNEKQHKYAGNVQESGVHLLALITDILDLSKVEAGRLEIDRQPVVVESVCQASLRLVKQLAHKKQLNVNLTIDEQVTVVLADERRLKQILVNLLSNAIKFTPEGGEIGLEVVGDVDRQAANFTVWDTGIGIAPEDMADLFRPFMQIDSRLARQHEGTGLGLSLVSRLTELHGGGVLVESEVGVGSRFTVSLPWSVSTGASFNEEAKPAPASGAVHTRPREFSPLILMAEDNEQNINLFSGFLEAQGYRLVIARNGREAIERAKENKPDLILMDIQMPEMDGLEATRRLRADAAFASIPIIALTALAMPPDRGRCLQAGANAYISKPISLTNLVETIETYLNTN